MQQLREQAARCEQESLQAQETVRALQQQLGKLQEHMALREQEGQQPQVEVSASSGQSRAKEGGLAAGSSAAAQQQRSLRVVNDNVTTHPGEPLGQEQQGKEEEEEEKAEEDPVSAEMEPISLPAAVPSWDLMFDEAVQQGQRLKQVRSGCLQMNSLVFYK